MECKIQQTQVYISFNNNLHQNKQFSPLSQLNMQQYRHADLIISPYGSHSIWIGDLTSAQEISWLKQNNIKTVITAAQGVTLKYDKSILHIHYKLQDTKHQNVAKILEQAADKIDKSIKQGSVLVHCGAGVSRSTTLVIGYLIKYKQMSFLDALRLTKSRRAVVCPNLGFQLQLKSFQKLLRSRQLINSMKNRNFQLPEIQKLGSIRNNQSLKLANHDSFENEIKQLKSNNRNINFGGGFVKKFTMGRRQNSLLGGYKAKTAQDKKSKNRQISSNGFNQFIGSHQKQHRDTEYIKKMAMFRFGITNTQKWRLG